jgi:hypothetical protein
VWASAAVERFAELVRQQRPIFRASQQGGSRGARSLSARPFQGLIEALQNADDLGATELRIAVRRSGRKRELLIVHDGERVRLHHAGAMVLPWLTTKDDDPEASGRFGIGQQTLRAIGGPLEVHCAPFEFRVDDEGPTLCESILSIPMFYEPERHETLLTVRLLMSVDPDKLIAFVEGLGSRSLIFLRSVRRVSYFALEAGERTVDQRLVEGNREELTLNLGGKTIKAERMLISNPRSHRQYARYAVALPLSIGEPQRHEKATAISTPIGVALPLSGSEVGSLYDRLPLPITPGFLFNLNAQFDPDAARTTVLDTEWNRRRIQDLGEMVAAVALDAFGRDPATAWNAVPLRSDVKLAEESWLTKELQNAVVAAAQQIIRKDLRLEAGGRHCALRDLVFEEERLDGLLTAADQEQLRPGLSAVMPQQRDKKERWREVLEDLGESHQIDVRQALDLFEQEDFALGPRKSEWFIAMAEAAIDVNIFSDFLSMRGILLADGTRVAPPRDDDPRSLVCHLEPGSLAAQLGIALPVHTAYLQESEQAKRVATELRELGRLSDEIDSADAALEVLSRENDNKTTGRLRIEDPQLLLLRDALERLGEDARRACGPRIGRNIQLRAQAYDDTGRITDWISPLEGYLPTAIDRDTDSFAKAAARTPGIYWLDSRYARLLKRTGGRSQLGAQRFLVLLGAATAPRLVPPDNERQVYQRDRRPVSKVYGLDRPKLQMLEIEPLQPFGQRYLLDDRWSPDLDQVIEDIRSDKSGKRRRKRGLFLLGVLARSWERYYSGYQNARAVYGQDGYWIDPQEIVATWLARAASKEWLPSGTGTLCAPTELCLPTEASRLAYADDKSMFLAKVNEYVLRSPALAALRLRRGPSATDLVERLAELQDGPLTTEAEADARTAYRLLALSCPTDSRRPVDDLTVRELRERFAGRRGQAGLLLINGKWWAPRNVFSGEHIFGRHRPFAPRNPELGPLWRTLELRKPEAADCIAVLREIAKAPLDAEDKGTILQTIRTLAANIDSMSPQLRAQLGRLPLWTGTEWRFDRPIYAFEESALAVQAATQVYVWQSGFSSFVELNHLLELLDVVALRLEDFAPLEIGGNDVVAGDRLRSRFALAVDHLRDELARSDQLLHDSLLEVTNWRALSIARVVIQERLRITARVGEKKPIVLSAEAFMLREPLALIASTEEHVGAADAGGRAIASLFSGDRQKIAWAWASMWQKAGSGIAPEQILLSTDKNESEYDEDRGRLIRLQTQATTRGARKGQSKGVGGVVAGRALSEIVVVQPLKDLNEYEPDEGTVINAGESRAGVIFPTRDPAAAAVHRHLARTGVEQQIGGVAITTPRTVPSPVTEREQLALDAVRKALRLDTSHQIADLRKRHGLGADAMDELRQFYEIKMESSGDFPKEVTLQGSQLDAAQDNEDFFLAVVAGLSDDSSELRVRFIFKPLDRLTLRIKGEATLSGISDVESLEYRFKKQQPPL